MTDVTRHDDPYTDWDAAYVIGALTPSERREYEQHLTGCDTCADAVAALASGPRRRNGSRSARGGGSTPRLAHPHATTGVDEAGGGADALQPPDEESLDRFVAETHSRKRKHRIRSVGAVVVAGVVIASAALILPTVLGSSAASDQAYRMAQVADTSLSGQVRLIAEPWGTRIEVNCEAARGVDPGAAAAAATVREHDDDPHADTSPAGKNRELFALYVVDAGGTATRIALWRAREGQTAVPVGTTELTVSQIADVEVRAVSNGTVQLRRAFVGTAG